ncbi:hypothetical protein GGX14DRAFT_558679 [Mycena pura]|uniref:FAD/NAD(P)-binding domain-containing protein n=1 Tax=Mycena pura TaxID=153505 RepID=A0AAD6YLI9_9AGAR|nr:hypothetical protein GGX14DRAFT_558679 [Mycena pura]
MSTLPLMLAHFPAPWLASTACLSFGFLVAWHKFCQLPPFWLKQLDSLGQSRKHALPGTAIVCGGSIAGLVAARICADHFERVIIVDPEIQDSEKPKTRIMQYNASHVFLTLFVNGARRLWPNFDSEVENAGGRAVLSDLQVHYSGVPLLTPHKDRTIAGSRATIQRVLHRLLLQHPSSAKITVMAGTVRGVSASDDINLSSIHSVKVRQLDGTHISLNDASLVVDCTGRTQAGYKWLKAAGFSVADIRSCYDGNLRYLTVNFTVPPELAARFQIPEEHTKSSSIYGYIPDDDTTSCLFALFFTGNNTMQLVFGETANTDMPRTAAEIIPFIKQYQKVIKPIPSWVIEVIELLCEHGNPSFDVLSLATLSFLRYDHMPVNSLPSNFIALGDASLTLNPIHGQVPLCLHTSTSTSVLNDFLRQGFAKIIMNGMTLNSLLHEIDAGGCGSTPRLPINIAARYFKNSARTMVSLWDSTRLNDYGLTACEPMDGETKDTGRFTRWVSKKLISAASQHPDVASALWSVRHMLAAERALLAPVIIWKILWTPSLFT